MYIENYTKGLNCILARRGDPILEKSFGGVR
jgi:hypothetical protein